MDEGGYLALNMRNIARGAGVSPGTLYSYFATKEEIFATLYAEAIEAHNERVAPLCERASDLESLLVELATAYLDLYSSYGRYFTLWSALLADAADPTDIDRAGSPLPAELSRALRAATVRQGELVGSAIRRLTPADGPAVTDEAATMTFLWAVLNGLGDHVTSGRRRLTPVSTDELIARAARTLATGLSASGPPPPGGGGRT